jgi:hypothetical protein
LKICYTSPFYSFDINELSNGLYSDKVLNTKLLTEELNLDILYSELSSVNEAEKKFHENKRKAFQSQYNDLQILGGSFNFIHWNDMPTGTYTSGWLPSAGTTWAVMSDYDQIAINHCGATAATNVALYYATTFNSYFKKNNSVYDTFVDLHNRIGNGPTIYATLISGLSGYVSSRGYSLNSLSISGFTAIKTATSENRTCLQLMTSSLFSWHWVITNGWREYSSGSKYVRIVTGWENSTLNFYLYPNQLVSTIKVWIQ